MTRVLRSASAFLIVTPRGEAARRVGRSAGCGVAGCGSRYGEEGLVDLVVVWGAVGMSRLVGLLARLDVGVNVVWLVGAG